MLFLQQCACEFSSAFFSFFALSLKDFLIVYFPSLIGLIAITNDFEAKAHRIKINSTFSSSKISCNNSFFSPPSPSCTLTSMCLCMFAFLYSLPSLIVCLSVCRNSIIIIFVCVRACVCVFFLLINTSIRFPNDKSKLILLNTHLH